MPRGYCLIQKIKNLKKLWKGVAIILLSLLIAFAGLQVLESNYSAKTDIPFKNTTFHFPAVNEYFNINDSVVPGYFASSASVYAFMYSPYADIFNLTLEISRDNSSWIEVPFVKSVSEPQNSSQFADLGTFTIDKPSTIFVYGRYSVPPQEVKLPSNVTPQIIIESVKGQIILKQQATPRDQMLEVLVFLTLFSLSITIIKFLRDEWGKKDLSKNPPEISEEPCIFKLFKVSKKYRMAGFGSG
jgi:hypothetical protein